MRSINIGLLGLGTVGQALTQLITESHPKIRVVKALVRHRDRERMVAVPVTIDPDEIIQDPEIDVVVDVMGGQHPAMEILSAAFQQGKDVVTANKEVMAYHGPALQKLARQHNRLLLYEASVAGGIPIIDAITHHLSVVPIDRIEGVLNGTCNFILSHMEEGHDYLEALHEAQRLGYAEQNPQADVEGHDTARKLVLLARLGFHSEIPADFSAITGITGITGHDVTRITSLGCGVRLVGRALCQNHRISLSVAPTVYYHGHPFLRLQGPQNAVQVTSAVGQFLFQGPGAGGMATATSVLSDILRIQQLVPGRDPSPTVPLTFSEDETPTVCFPLDPEASLPQMLPDELRRTSSYAILSRPLPIGLDTVWGLRQYAWGEEEGPTLR